MLFTYLMKIRPACFINYPAQEMKSEKNLLSGTRFGEGLVYQSFSNIHCCVCIRHKHGLCLAYDRTADEIPSAGF